MQLRRLGLLLAVLAIVVVTYAIAVRHFQRDAERMQHVFTVGASPADRLEVSAQVMSVNPVKDSLLVRFGFKPFGKFAADRFGRLATDMSVVVMTSDGYRAVQLAAGEIPGSLEKEVELDEGSPNFYPFDRYSARLGVAAFVRSKAGRSAPVATVVQYEEDLGNYGIAANLGPESTSTSIDVHLAIWRSAAILTFSLMMFAAMALVSASVVLLTVLVVLRRIESEFGLMLWSGAMLFALPAVRNSLPDSPSLGIQADFYVFMWAETSVALSMVILTAYLLFKRAKETLAEDAEPV